VPVKLEGRSNKPGSLGPVPATASSASIGKALGYAFLSLPVGFLGPTWTFIEASQSLAGIGAYQTETSLTEPKPPPYSCSVCGRALSLR
jgi:hypothetical protein